MVYIAQDYGDEVLGVVIASSQQLANAFWQGEDIYPHHIKSLSEESLENHPTGVIPIVRTVEAKIYDNGSYYKGRMIGD